MTIILLEIRNYPIYVQLNVNILSITIGENERSLFALFKDGNKYEIDLLFVHIKR